MKKFYKYTEFWGISILVIITTLIFLFFFNINNDINIIKKDEILKKSNPNVILTWEKGFKNIDKLIKVKDQELIKKYLINNHSYDIIELSDIEHYELFNLSIIVLTEKELFEIDSILLIEEKKLHNKLQKDIIMLKNRFKN